MVRFLSTVVILLKASTMVDAFAMTFESSCVNFTFPDDSVARELCYSGNVIGPSICLATLPNGTDVDYSCGDLTKVTYTFEKEMEGMETSIEWGYYNDTYNGLEEVISDASGDCNATANGESCDTCIFCNDGSVEADCTNVALGAKVECGDIFVQNLSGTPYPFFPFLVEKTMGSTCEVGPEADKDMGCPGGEFCQLNEGVCNSKMGFHTGVCAPIPMICTMIYLPVCGCDAVDYSSECLAHTAGVSVSRTGKCDGTEVFTDDTSSTIAAEALPENVTETTSTVAVDTQPQDITFTCEVGPSADPDMSCLDGEFCQLDVGTCNNKMAVHYGVCTSILTDCTKEMNPVCGCDQMDYANGCAAHTAGVSVSRTGECSGNSIGAKDVNMTSAEEDLTNTSDSARSLASSLTQVVTFITTTLTLVVVVG